MVQAERTPPVLTLYGRDHETIEALLSGPLQGSRAAADLSHLLAALAPRSPARDGLLRGTAGQFGEAAATAIADLAQTCVWQGSFAGPRIEFGRLDAVLVLLGRFPADTLVAGPRRNGFAAAHQALRAWFHRTPIPAPHDLRALYEFEGVAAAVRRLLRYGEADVSRAIKFGLAVLAHHGDHGQEAAARVAQRLIPACYRVEPWLAWCEEPVRLAQTLTTLLERAPAMSAAETAAVAGALLDHLLTCGAARLARTTLRSLARGPWAPFLLMPRPTPTSDPSLVGRLLAQVAAADPPITLWPGGRSHGRDAPRPV